MYDLAPDIERPDREPDFISGGPDQRHFSVHWKARGDEPGVIVKGYSPDKPFGSYPEFLHASECISQVASPDSPLADFYGYIGLKSVVREYGSVTLHKIQYPHPEYANRQLRSLDLPFEEMRLPAFEADPMGHENPTRFTEHVANNSSFLLCTNSRYGVYDALCILPAAAILPDSVVQKYQSDCRDVLNTNDKDRISTVASRFAHHVSVLDFAAPVVRAIALERKSLQMATTDLGNPLKPIIESKWGVAYGAVGQLLGIPADSQELRRYAMDVQEYALTLSSLTLKEAVEAEA